MYFLNLSLIQFIAVFGSFSAVAVWFTWSSFFHVTVVPTRTSSRVGSKSFAGMVIVRVGASADEAPPAATSATATTTAPASRLIG